MAKCFQVLSGAVEDAMSTIRHFTPRRSRGMMARLSKAPPSAKPITRDRAVGAEPSEGEIRHSKGVRTVTAAVTVTVTMACDI